MTHRQSAMIALAIMLGTAGQALAHARLKNSLPTAGSTVKSDPQELTLWFSEALEPEYCTVEVADRVGNRVEDGKPLLDADNPTVLHVRLKALTPGSYTVSWRVVSVDTHTTDGRFEFKRAP